MCTSAFARKRETGKRGGVQGRKFTTPCSAGRGRSGPPYRESTEAEDRALLENCAKATADGFAVDEILASGQDPNKAVVVATADGGDRFNVGYTALHFAARHGHVRIAHMLLRAKADPNVLTHGRMTPLILAAGTDSARHHAVVRHLVRESVRVWHCTLRRSPRSELAALPLAPSHPLPCHSPRTWPFFILSFLFSATCSSFALLSRR